MSSPNWAVAGRGKDFHTRGNPTTSLEATSLPWTVPAGEKPWHRPCSSQNRGDEMGIGPWGRRCAKALAAGAAHHLGVRRGLASLRRAAVGGRRVLWLGYHRVVEDLREESARSIPALLVSRRTFERQMEEISARGYDFATPGRAIEVLAGRSRARKDLCVLTFDDGYRDVYRHALPVLKRAGIPAIAYLPAAYIGTQGRLVHDRIFHLVSAAARFGLRQPGQRLPLSLESWLLHVLDGRQTVADAIDGLISRQPRRLLLEAIDQLERMLEGEVELLPRAGDLMDWGEVRRLAAAGIEVGAHTLHHSVLSLEGEDEIDRQVTGSRDQIAREVGKPVVDFSYPNGWYSDPVIRVLVRRGFRSAVTTEDLPNRIGGDPYRLKRKVLWENFSTGLLGDYSPSLTACQIDDLFGILGATRPVCGRFDGGTPPRMSAMAVEERV